MNDPTSSRCPGDKLQAARPASIIVLARECIGDLVCTTPALRSLRRLYPQAHIALEVGERALCVLANNPHIDELIRRPDRQGASGKWKFLRLLRRRKFDLAVLLDDSADMPLIAWLGGVPRRVGLTRKDRFAHLLTDRVPYDETGHEMVDNFLRVVGCLGGDISDPLPEIFPSPADVQFVDRLLCEAGIRPEERLVALNPGTSALSKNWPPERFAELGNLLSSWPQVRLLLLPGPGDGEITQAIVAGMRTPPRVLAGTTVMQQAEIQRRCDVLVTGDTGPMHLACATQTPVVALFGITDPKDFGPGYAPGNIVIRKVSGCPGCTWKACAHQNRCMRLIAAEEVAGAVREVLCRSGE
ncbi:MAG TPA: lipopolysaccharide heptosyltransferase II [Chthonomonadaceae bacterium]|nr:lipopolysaccharide heptosyltransferase II [Chthonomonadaceae bacterium]